MSEIVIKQPVSVLNRNVKFDIKDFFIQISKTAVQATVQGLTGNLIGSVATVVNGVFDISKTTQLELKVEELAWLLIARSLTQAITEMLTSDQDLFGSNVDEAAIASVAAKIENKINESEIAIDNDFFEAPHHLALLDDLEIFLIEWFQQLGLDEAKAKSTYERLKGQFSFSLDKEWVSNASQYISIIDQLNTPFTKATVKQRNIRQYRSWLQQQVNERMFDEAFGLSQIYVPLRAYCEVRNLSTDNKEQEITSSEDNIIINSRAEKNISKKVCDLYSEISDWLSTYQESDTLRIISGGPGSGKSSFAKILAAKLAEKPGQAVLFIPLHRFRLDDYLLEAVRKFVSINPILTNTDLTNEYDLLLIFDGLDELSMQSGNNVKEAASNFIEEVKVALRDQGSLRWKAIVTGRELSVQSQKSQLKKEKTVLHLLPYFISEDKREEFDDSEGLLIEDQRNDWWSKFSELKGLEFKDLPSELATKHLEPITTEPLLNYLVSLSYLRQDITFTEDTSLNQIYADLLDSVHERKYTATGVHKSLNDMDKDNFIRILQEIALTVWHENGRTATVDQIKKQCETANIVSYFGEFSDDMKSGVTRLLMAFYFREFGSNQGDKTFEFTHKSFGEYLTAKRIMLELEIILEEVERSKKRAGSGWTVEEAFEKWIRICGPQPIDSYLNDFLAGEIRIMAETESGLSIIFEYQKLIIELIQLAVSGQSPIKKLNLATFSEDLTYSRNAETALLKVHSLCANSTNEVIKNVEYENSRDFDKWLSLLDYRIMSALNHLYLPKIKMHSSFIGSNLKSSVFNNASLVLSTFFMSIFNNASFESANLSEVRAEHASFKDTNFKSTDLRRANFRAADLTGANLTDANLDGTNFTNANLENAKFENTNHEKAIFTGANLKGTILENLYPSEEKLEEEKLEEEK